MPIMCYTCGKRERRNYRDSMCRECRNEYNRVWKAKKRHGPDLEEYRPTGPRKKQEPKPYNYAVTIRGTPNSTGGRYRVK